MNIRENCVTAFIGPSGCGKSTFLKTLNRMNDLVDGVRITGEVKLDDEDIYAEGVDTTVLRKRIGMVFQQPNPFPMSIYDMEFKFSQFWRPSKKKVCAEQLFLMRSRIV